MGGSFFPGAETGVVHRHIGIDHLVVVEIQIGVAIHLEFQRIDPFFRGGEFDLHRLSGAEFPFVSHFAVIGDGVLKDRFFRGGIDGECQCISSGTAVVIPFEKGELHLFIQFFGQKIYFQT